MKANVSFRIGAGVYTVTDHNQHKTLDVNSLSKAEMGQLSYNICQAKGIKPVKLGKAA